MDASPSIFFNRYARLAGIAQFAGGARWKFAGQKTLQPLDNPFGTRLSPMS
jgi:hypothetical protein